MNIISHIYREPNGEWQIQDNASHQHGVAMLAGQFASDFGMRTWGYAMGLLHDKGKERKNFQDYIRKNSGFVPDQSCSGDHKHAFIGGIIAKKMYPKMGVEQLLCNQIVSHHSGLHDYCDLDEILNQEIPKEVSFDVNCPKLEQVAFVGLEAEDIHHISRMLYSCLVDADYLDTESFMDKVSARARMNKKDLSVLFPLLENHLAKMQTSAPHTAVNVIRAQILERCKLVSECKKGFYSLTVPTGGGKTLSSLYWAFRHAMHNGMKRIIIAIPYTSIIIQTASILKNIFGEENVLEHHSNFNPECIDNPTLRQKLRLASENWDSPIVVTTNVQLFESLFSNRPSDCRKLHNIVNSVIVLDEVQALPVDCLQPIVDALRTYQKHFGISVLFTTASQPLLSGDIEGCNPYASFPALGKVEEIIPSEMKLHHKLRRVHLKIDKHAKSYDEVAEMLCKHKRVLCVVNTRRDAKELFDRLPREGVTIHLSRMMCPKHIACALHRLKSVLSDSSQEVVRVISTQLVEAGVDIDFPVVFRQEAGLDSLLQAAGRCNREGKCKLSTTYVFSLGKEHSLPSGFLSMANDARLALPSDSDWFEPKVMTQYFRQLYCRQNTFDRHEMKYLLYNPRELCFSEASRRFHLIENTGIPLIINRDNSMDLVEELREKRGGYLLMKKLAQYTVNVHKYDFDVLRKMGAIEKVLDEFYVLVDRLQYDESIGLRMDNHWIEEILIC